MGGQELMQDVSQEPLIQTPAVESVLVRSRIQNPTMESVASPLDEDLQVQWILSVITL